MVDAVRCAIEVQNGLIERNAGVPEDKRIGFRVGIHLGDVVEESDGDLMGDGVNIAARLEGIAKPGAICLSEDAYRQVKGRLEMTVSDLGATQLKNIAEPVRVYSVEVGKPAGPRKPVRVSEQSLPGPRCARRDPGSRRRRDLVLRRQQAFSDRATCRDRDGILLRTGRRRLALRQRDRRRQE